MTVHRERRRLLGIGALAVLVAAGLLLAVGLAAALAWSTWDGAQRAAARELLLPRLPLLGLAALVAGGLAAAAALPLWRRLVDAPARLEEQARMLLNEQGAAPAMPLDAPAAPALLGIAASLRELAAQRDRLRHDVQDQVAAASAGIERERNRLAALMSELQQSVVVCNLDGRILLYNQRARLQLRAVSEQPQVAGGAELIGLGRPIDAVFDRRLVDHALERVRQRLQRGDAHPSAQFVTTTRAGTLLRARLAAVRGGSDGAQAGMDSFVLLLDDITLEHERESEREQLLHGLTEGGRASLANLRAAVEVLDDRGLDPALRARFLRVIHDEVAAMGSRINELSARAAQLAPSARWPLDEMLGADALQAAQWRIARLPGLRVAAPEVDAALWLRLDSWSVLQALVYLAERLRDEFQIGMLQLRLSAADALQARLDLVWSGPAVSTETVMGWELDPISTDGQTSGLTIRDVVARHGGEFWFERDRIRQQAFFRFLLPRAPEAPAADRDRTTDPVDASAAGSKPGRPEFFDFDLFGSTELGRALEDRPLAKLTYTVFDTETTGLDPSGGDEIIQIGAARIVNGKLLRGECFEQLVDPRRPIPATTIPIHGITPDRVRGQPTLAQVLPAFRAYASDSVLVAHNAAFDMRFLQLKQVATGVSFDLPVLDTLLLSALVHPNQPSHRLEAIAERFGIPVVGRHTALGDALVTAEVLLRLIPLLARQGIRTLGQAREAAQRTYFARVKY